MRPLSKKPPRRPPPEATPEETPAPQSDTTEEKTESLREFRFTTGLGGANGDFLYDDDGRLSHITLGIYDDFSQDYDIHFDYTDGKASASFDAAQAAAMEGSPYVPEVTDLTLKDDGTPDALSACTDCAVYIEFNEDGLPSFFAVAQEDVGYQITYTRTDDGRFAWTAPSASMDTSTTTAPNLPMTSSRPPARSSTNNLSGSCTSNPMDLRY